MEAVTLLGFAAAIFTTTSFIPQVVKAVKTRHTQDISLLMYVIMVVGIGLWFVYGLLIQDLPVIAANGVTLCLVSFVFILKLKYK